MNLRDLLPVYAKNARLKAMEHLLAENGPKTVFCEGLCASSLPFVLATLSFRADKSRVFLCVLDDEESAGYFYQDLVSFLLPFEFQTCRQICASRRCQRIAAHRSDGALGKSSGRRQKSKKRWTSFCNNLSKCVGRARCCTRYHRKPYFARRSWATVRPYGTFSATC